MKDDNRGRIVLVEPLARSTGHQTWFASNLVRELVSAGIGLTLITFDGMHDDADLEFRETGSEVQRVLGNLPRWARWLVGRITGIEAGKTASPSSVRRHLQIYLYNYAATAFTVFYAARTAGSHGPDVLHLLCPPSWLTILLLWMARRPHTRVLITTFAAPERFRGKRARVTRLCRNGEVTILVQTQALAAEWGRAVGAGAVRTIAMPTGSNARREDAQECRRLLDLPADKPIVAVIGCMAPKKGYIELFQAIKVMPKDFRVLLIGDTPAWITPEPSQVAGDAGWLDHTVYQNRFVTEKMWPVLLGAVDIVALLYRDADASSGILSLCQQYGVPVIATSAGEIGAKVRRERIGLTADPNRPEEIRHALAELLTCAGASRRRSVQHRDFEPVTPYVPAPSWSEVARAHIVLYRQMQGTTNRSEDYALSGGSPDVPSVQRGHGKA